MKHNFSAGKYWLGDPCYVVKDEDWNVVGEETGWFGSDSHNEKSKDYNGLFYYGGMKCFANSTRYGDGVFTDNENREYGVDAGLLGILPLEICNGDLRGGNVVEFENDFVVTWNEGHFEFGDVVIETGDDEDSENEDDYWDDQEEDEDDYWSYETDEGE